MLGMMGCLPNACMHGAQLSQCYRQALLSTLTRTEKGVYLQNGHWAWPGGSDAV